MRLGNIDISGRVLAALALICATGIAVAVIVRPPRYKAVWSSRLGQHLILDTHTGVVSPLPAPEPQSNCK